MTGCGEYRIDEVLAAAHYRTGNRKQKHQAGRNSQKNGKHQPAPTPAAFHTILKRLRSILSGFFYPDDPCPVIRFYLSQLTDIPDNRLHKSNVRGNRFVLKHYLITYITPGKIS